MTLNVSIVIAHWGRGGRGEGGILNLVLVPLCLNEGYKEQNTKEQNTSVSLKHLASLGVKRFSLAFLLCF